MEIRVGQGIDVHRLSNDENLVLGGVKIPADKGLVGYSDGDVLLHAVMDAMLGALSLGDIGKHFPDDDPKYHNIDSKTLLKKTNELILSHEYRVYNLDSTVMAEQPKLAPFIPEMKQAISGVLQIEEKMVSVKATTFEQLGFVGEGRGIMAQAVVLLTKVHNY